MATFLKCLTEENPTINTTVFGMARTVNIPERKVELKQSIGVAQAKDLLSHSSPSLIRTPKHSELQPYIPCPPVWRGRQRLHSPPARDVFSYNGGSRQPFPRRRYQDGRLQHAPRRQKCHNRVRENGVMQDLEARWTAVTQGGSSCARDQGHL